MEQEAKEAESLAVAASERVATARDTEIANRGKQIAVIKATEEAEQEAVGIKVAAAASKVAALDDAEAIKTTAQAQSDAVIIRAKADEERYKVEAEGKEKLNEAENRLSQEIIRMRVQLETIQHASEIVEASMKPIEAIEGMKIVNVSGLGGLTGGAAGSGNGGNESSQTGGGDNLADQLINSLLKYRGLAPVVDSILQEVGIDTSSVKGLTNIVQDTMSHDDQTDPEK